MFTSIDYEKFRTLRITHVATRFEELIADEANDELTPEQLFLTAIDDALEQRRANRIAALIRKAGFPIPTATIAELDYREGRGINPTRMRRYAARDWSAEPVNLLINSPAGGGKTYLACAIGIAACQNQHDVAYTRMDELARKLVIARGDAIAHQRLLNELSDTDLLIIDDFLTVGIDPDAASDLFAILANREHRRPTVIASQSGPDYWVTALPDRVAADSIVNRLANNARTINLGDVDMRRQRAHQARQADTYWELAANRDRVAAAINRLLPGRPTPATRSPDQSYRQALSPNQRLVAHARCSKVQCSGQGQDRTVEPSAQASARTPANGPRHGVRPGAPAGSIDWTSKHQMSLLADSPRVNLGTGHTPPAPQYLIVRSIFPAQGIDDQCPPEP